MDKWLLSLQSNMLFRGFFFGLMIGLLASCGQQDTDSEAKMVVGKRDGVVTVYDFLALSEDLICTYGKRLTSEAQARLDERYPSLLKKGPKMPEEVLELWRHLADDPEVFTPSAHSVDLVREHLLYEQKFRWGTLSDKVSWTATWSLSGAKFTMATVAIGAVCIKTLGIPCILGTVLTGSAAAGSWWEAVRTALRPQTRGVRKEERADKLFPADQESPSAHGVEITARQTQVLEELIASSPVSSQAKCPTPQEALERVEQFVKNR